MAEYSAKWQLMQSAHIRAITPADATPKVRRNIMPRTAAPHLIVCIVGM